MDESRLDYVSRLKEISKRAKYTINYEVESDSADDRYTGNSEMDVNASSPFRGK